MSIEESSNKIIPYKRPIKSFEADNDVAEMLENAKEDGLVIGEICNRALRKYGVAIIREILAEHNERRQKRNKPLKDKTLTSKEASALVGKGSSVAVGLVRESGKKQTTESPSENKSSRASGGHSNGRLKKESCRLTSRFVSE